MSPRLAKFQLAMRSLIGKELLHSIWNAPWEVPSFRAIEELGIAYGSNTGARRSRNEDRVAVAQVSAFSQEQFFVAIVCDGVGGSEMGDVAATLSIATFLTELAQLREISPLAELLKRLIRKTDDTVRNQLEGSGTTTASILLISITKGELAAANIGDSRLFSWKSDGSNIAQVSVDDTFENELSRLPGGDPSILDERNLRGTLSQAIGEKGRASSDLRIVVFGLEVFNAGVIMASDGAWKANESGFNSVATNASSPSEAARRILAFSGWTGGVDNVSVIAIQDIRKILSGERDPFPVQPGGARMSAWICDGKYFFNDLEPTSLPRRNPAEKEPPLRTEETNKKVKRKWHKFQKPSKRPPPDLKQLHLEPENAPEKPSAKKFVVEVSTDEETEPLTSPREEIKQSSEWIPSAQVSISEDPHML